jgi:uncharacterized integral membrane protein
MSRLMGVLSVLVVVLLAMWFAAANAGHRVNLNLGFVTLYQVPVALVAFCGLFVGMVLMFGTGVHSDLKVRSILRERLAEEAQREQTWIDRNQRDLFAEEKDSEQPEIAVPEAAAPEAAAPEAAAPEAAAPEAAAPEAAVPEAAVPEAAVPEAAVPEAAVPETEPDGDPLPTQ